MTVPRMSPDEFREGGYLQEVNRLLLHPLGLALAVEYDDDGGSSLVVIDDRADPEGWVFALGGASSEDQGRFRRNHHRVNVEREQRYERRRAMFGGSIQPIPDAFDRMP